VPTLLRAIRMQALITTDEGALRFAGTGVENLADES
jgi:hypothetical protein